MWQDNRPVTLISTDSDPTTTSSVQRKKRDGTSTSYSCPNSLALYKQYMGGVDRNDQLRGCYHVRQKTRKHYKYIFWFLVDLAITNAYILSQSNPDIGVKNIKDFRTSLAKELIGTYASKKRVGRSSIAPPTTRFCQHHFPMRVTSKHRCHDCHNYKKERWETVWLCKDCQLYLCHTGLDESDCFLLYHTRYVDGPTHQQLI